MPTKTTKDILLDIQCFIQKWFDKKQELFEQENLRFFGEPLYLNQRDMMYLFQYAESVYHVRFNISDINDPNFYSLDGFSNTISKKISS